MTGVLIFGHTRVDQNLLVADISGEVILGMDFLAEKECRLDLPKCVLHLQHEMGCWDEKENNAHSLVMCKDHVELSPYQSTVIQGKIPWAGNITECRKWGVIDPCRILVLVASTVVSSSLDFVPV
jgi:hypothetical protein